MPPKTKKLEDVLDSVTISKDEYEDLIRDSEKLLTIHRYIDNSECPTIKGLKAILGYKKEESE